MENELRSLNDSPASDELSLPHFDEEATLQSARPVVPLHEVKAQGRFRRRWLLGGALALAATFGAVTASLIYSRGSQPEEASVVDTNADSTRTADDFVSPSGEASGSSVNPSEAATSVPEPERVEATSEPTQETSKSAVTVKKQPPQNTVRKQSDRVVLPSVDQDREEVLAEEVEFRREQRREARRLRRERRVNERNSGEGLTRIREIFEGSPRP